MVFPCTMQTYNTYKKKTHVRWTLHKPAHVSLFNLPCPFRQPKCHLRVREPVILDDTSTTLLLVERATRCLPIQAVWFAFLLDRRLAPIHQHVILGLLFRAIPDSLF
jgi:hypothetical protein